MGVNRVKNSFLRSSLGGVEGTSGEVEGVEFKTSLPKLLNWLGITLKLLTQRFKTFEKEVLN